MTLLPHLTSLRWSRRTLATACGVPEVRVRRWEADPATCPPAVLEALQTLADFHRAHPMPWLGKKPQGWPRRALPEALDAMPEEQRQVVLSEFSAALVAALQRVTVQVTTTAGEDTQ